MWTSRKCEEVSSQLVSFNWWANSKYPWLMTEAGQEETELGTLTSGWDERLSPLPVWETPKRKTILYPMAWSSREQGGPWGPTTFYERASPRVCRTWTRPHLQRLWHLTVAPPWRPIIWCSGVEGMLRGIEEELKRTSEGPPKVQLCTDEHTGW